MVIAQCTLNLQSCMIPFCVRSNTLIKMVYHSFCHDKCTSNHNLICTQFCFWWTAEFPEFRFLENGQIVFGKAHKYYMGLKCLDGYTAVQQKKLARHGFTKGYQILCVVRVILQIFNDQSIFANSIASIWSHKNLKIVPKHLGFDILL